MGYDNGKNQGKKLKSGRLPKRPLATSRTCIGARVEIRLSIDSKLEVMTITGKPKLQEVAQAIEATTLHIAELNKIWSDLHDGT